MLYPIIRVIDVDSLEWKTHIVGTDKDDRLLINPKTGGLDYYNSGDGRGTNEFRGGYVFEGKSKDPNFYTKIKFVTRRELEEIIKDEKKKNSPDKTQIDED